MWKIFGSSPFRIGTTGTGKKMLQEAIEYLSLNIEMGPVAVWGPIYLSWNGQILRISFSLLRWFDVTTTVPASVDDDEIK